MLFWSLTLNSAPAKVFPSLSTFVKMADPGIKLFVAVRYTIVV